MLLRENMTLKGLTKKFPYSFFFKELIMSSYKSRGRADAAKGKYDPPHKRILFRNSEKEKQNINKYKEGHADKTREMKKKK